MELNENAEADTSQVTDRRGSGGGGLAGLPIPIGGLGGGIGGLVVLALLVLGGFMGGNALFGDDGGGDNGDLEQTCSTANPDRLKNTDCRNLLYINSIQAYWKDALPETLGQQYEMSDTVFFSQAVSTACGNADSGVGPFYCPEDNLIYIDLSFYNELASRFGADGEFAQPYVLAHEYGHHIQDILGTEADVRRQMERDPGNANALSVKLELQADCYAGVWAKHATETKSGNGVAIFKSITQADIDQALEAAAAIGDDAIQKKMGGGVDESKFTHGSSAQRKQWFSTGYSTGDPKACNTFTS
ncbi:KPN_02809 family neutral zinc metallopeptidase [Luedemannella helvata]|uniref:Neutral zinc metallopeptidase n=1 Tax=Luedemannella helvata TaxID=349315 RepID=A0ABP4WQZ1_9ACTN